LIIQSNSGEKWQNFLTFLISSIQSENIFTKFISFLVLAEIIPFYFDTFSKFRRKLIPIYLKNLEASQAELRFSAIHSLTVYISVINSSEPSQYADTLRPLLKSAEFLCQMFPEQAENSLKSLVDLAEAEPLYFKQDLAGLQLFLEEIRKNCSSLTVKTLVIELVVNVVELNVASVIDKSQFLMSLCHALLEELVLTAPGLMFGVDDSAQRTLLGLMMRVVRSVGESIVEYLLRVIERVFQQTPSEQELFAGCLVLGEIFELIVGNEKLEVISRTVQSFMQDSRGSLRWSALRLLGKVLQVQDNDLQDTFSSSFSTIFKAGLTDSEDVIVRKALKVLSKTLEGPGKDECRRVTCQFLPMVLACLDREGCLSRALEVLTVFCSKCKEHLDGSFHDLFFKLLSKIDLVNDEQKLEVFECLIALRKTAKSEEFSEVLEKYVKIVLIMHQLAPEKSAVVKSLICLSEKDGKGLARYLQVVLPVVLIRLDDLNQVEDCLQTLLSLMDSANEDFRPFAEETLQKLENFIENHQEDLPVLLVVNLVSCLINLISQAPGQYRSLPETTSKFTSFFWVLAENESDLEVTCEVVVKIKNLIEINARTERFDPLSIISSFEKVLLKRKQLQEKDKKRLNHDLRSLVDMFFNDLPTCLVETLDSLYKVHLLKLDSKKLTESEALFTLSLLSHLLKHKASSLNLQDLQSLLQSLTPYERYPHYHVKKRSISILESLFQHLPKDLFKDQAAFLLAHLESMLLLLKDSKKVTDQKLKDLTIIALGGLIQWKHDCLALDLLVPWWLSFFPLTSHKKHAKVIHDLLADLCLHLPFLTNNENVLNVLLTVTFTEFCTVETMAKVKRIAEVQGASCLNPVLSSKLVKLQTL
jgi:hypothetical protein